MSQALNKVEVIMKITEIGFPLIKLHNLGFGGKEKTMEGFLLRRHQFFQQILPLTALKLSNPLFLTNEGSENSNFLLDKYICHLVFYQNIY